MISILRRIQEFFRRMWTTDPLYSAEPIHGSALRGLGSAQQLIDSPDDLIARP
jgi:hypothetical protein